MAWSPPAHNAGIVWVSAPGDYATFNSNHTPDGTGAGHRRVYRGRRATLAHAFEPFFTTKEAGRGSGLGLSMVQGFAAQSGGAVEIVSSLGQGTNVTLWLPHAEGRSAEAAPLDKSRSVSGPTQARILVCDDDGDVRALVGTYLRDRGYTVWEANNPTLALQILERERPIDLL
jgi:hypothetical protein